MVATGGTATFAVCRCGIIPISVDFPGQCAHCDFPCTKFPHCLLCANLMEPEQVGKNGITMHAEAIMWAKADDWANQAWENSEFNKQDR